MLASQAPLGPRALLRGRASIEAPGAAAQAPPAAPPPVLAAPPSGQNNVLPFRSASGPSLLAANLRKLGQLVVPPQLPGGPVPGAGAGRAAEALQVSHAAELQDVAAAMVLCEAVYRSVEYGTQQAEVAIRKLQRQLPHAPRLSRVQWSPAGQEQRYVIASTPDAIVVAFLGTMRPADHLVNLHLRHAPAFGKGQGSGEEGGRGGGGAAAAHAGYLRRAAGIPAEQLYQLARVQGKRLVLAGHSLGGAVATLCAVRLLDALPPALHPTLSCVGFAVPPVGNAALAALAQAHGWQQRIKNYVLPEDWVPGLLSLFHRHQDGSASSGGSSASTDGSSNEGGEGASGGSPPKGGQPHERTSSVLGTAGGRLLTALATLPSHLLPRLVHVGRQISLPAGTAGPPLARRARRRQRQEEQPHDPLCPLAVPPGRLAAHRMISYRLRIAGLYGV